MTPAEEKQLIEDAYYSAIAIRQMNDEIRYIRSILLTTNEILRDILNHPFFKKHNLC